MHVQRAYFMTTLILTLAIMAGCASSGNSTSPAKNAADGGGTPNPTTSTNSPVGGAAAPEPDHAQSTGSASDMTKHDNAGKAASSDKADSVKLYRMNAVYSFVPIHKEETSDKVVLLTFDDGPKADKTTSALLDILDKHKAKAIFFVNGYRVKQHPELLRKIADRGQTIGNHSWDHIDLKKEKEATVKQQVGDVSAIVKQTIGREPVFFRPPFGSGNDMVKSIVRGHGMLYMTWSDGSLDWDKSTKNKPDKVIANVLEQLHPGVNILMHELPWTTEALDELLTKLEDKGYGFIDPATIELTPDSPGKTAK